MEYESQVVELSADSYNTYDANSYPEILEKDNRPYNCLLIETHYDYFICLPYRTHIKHKYAFRFKKSKRALKNKSGIDYTKMAVVKEFRYISPIQKIIDQDEYRETMQNLTLIVNNAVEYLEEYINYTNGESSISEQEFQRRYSRSTLPYFHKELGIENN